MATHKKTERMDTWEAWNDLSTALSHIRSLLRGAAAIGAHYGDRDAEQDLVYLAENLTEEAKKQADRMFNAYRKETERSNTTEVENG